METWVRAEPGRATRQGLHPGRVRAGREPLLPPPGGRKVPPTPSLRASQGVGEGTERVGGTRRQGREVSGRLLAPGWVVALILSSGRAPALPAPGAPNSGENRPRELWTLRGRWVPSAHPSPTRVPWILADRPPRSHLRPPTWDSSSLGGPHVLPEPSSPPATPVELPRPSALR